VEEERSKPVWHRILRAPYPDLAWQSRRAMIFHSAALFKRQVAHASSPARMLLAISGSRDAGRPPIFLVFLIAFLLVVNGFVAFFSLGDASPR
jgi:hypothetical protein